MATYGPEIHQSQHAKSVSHIINIVIISGKLIACYVCSVKIHDLAEMKEIYAIINVEDAGGQ